MKLTKKLEAEILKAYSEIWDAYLRGDMRTFASILDENCYIIGSAAGEVFKNKKAAVKYYNSTAEQITGKAQFRNRKIKVMPVEGGFMVNEASDFYLLIDDHWTFYGPARISSLFHKKNNKWKVIHQHGSFPDSKTEEGEQVNTDKIKAENIQLRDAVKRRTEELEYKNRELEIETALERVRAVAMAMRRPEDLPGIGETLFTELKSLGFIDLRNTEIIIISDAKETLKSYYYSDYGVTGVVEVDYKSDPKVQSWIDQLKKANDAFAEIVITEKEIKAWRKYREQVGHVPDPKLDKAKSVYYYSYSIGMGGLSISTFKPALHEQIRVLERFRNVFNLSYQRYIDIAEAEAQAREAQIEAALERVRSRSMAMHKSDDLHQVIKVVTEQLFLLGLKFNVANFAKIDPDGSWDLWLSTPEQAYPALIHVPYLDHPIFNRITEEVAKGNDFYTDVYTPEQSNIFFHYFFENTIAKNTPEERKQFVYSSTGFVRSLFLTKNIWFSVGRYDAIPFTDEENAIFKRFANVFEQAYTRFLDLQKAEAQAREGQIEASLERVRSRAMAMQNSDELKELIGTVFTELTKLDIVLTRCLIMIYDPRSNDSVWWMANSEAPTEPIGLRIQNHGHPPYIAYLKAWHEKKLNWVYVLEGAVKKDWDDFLFVESELSHLPDFVIAGMKAPERVYLNSSFNSFGNLTLATLEPLSNEHFDILLRFAKVFDLTYTRFNDLQKAEAQTKEAQIELALERVRARTMAMHKSEELAETAQVLFQQLSELGGIPDRIAIGIADEEEGVVNYWSTDQSGRHIDKKFKARLSERTVLSKTYIAWKDQKRSLVVDLHGVDVIEWVKFAREEMGVIVKDEFIKDRRVHSFAFFSQGWILVTTHEPQSTETIQILERFASVFNLTYRRFLDLQKAEGQANEARIEIALERIRARALAMHKSDELMEVAKVLREQMALLGQPELEASVIHLYEEDPDYILSWRAFRPSEAYNKIAYGHMSIPKNSCEFIREWLTKFYSEEKEYTIELSGAKQEEWYDLFFKLAPDVVNSMREENSIHEKRYYRFSKFSGGALLMVSKQEPSEEVTYLQRRAAVVFDLAYRRFSDLQKAEAQAREAQIEMALEKVRSRSLAMHKSEELQEVVNTVFERLQDLNIEMASANIAIFKEGTRNYDYWIASPVQKRSASFHMPYTDLSLTRDLIAARENGKEFSTTAYSFEEKNEWFEYAFKNTDFKFLNEERKQFILNAPAITVAIAFSKNTGVQLNRYTSKLYTEREGEILKRFSKVFEQAYIRFRDLEKAEAQARESQIEAALERVRSRTMAMHKSDELAETAQLLYHEFGKLSINTFTCGYMFIDEEINKQSAWVVLPDGTLIPNFIQFPLTGDHVLDQRYKDWKERKALHILEIQGDANKEHHRFLSNHVPQFVVDEIFSKMPDRIIFHCANFSNGYLLILGTESFSLEDQQTIIRFAKVFDLTYRRFLDLQKAEAQAREAQIEASLERVRSKTMAMHNSQDVGDTVATMFDELVKLGIETVRCGIGIMHEANKMEVWTAKKSENKKVELIIGSLDMTIHPLQRGMYNGWKNKDATFSYELKDNDLVDYFTKLINSPDYHINYDVASLPQHQFHNDFYFPEGALFSFSAEQLSTEASQIFKRFAGVFGQTYRRYLDLQKAEANVREAQIEAGLERVRARTMAMHTSEDVGAATATMFTELEKLDIQNLRGGITIIKADDKQEVWSVTNLPDGRTIRSIGEFDMHLHPFWRQLLKVKLNNGDYNYYRLAGKDKEDYIAILNATPNYLAHPIKEFPDVHVQSYFFGEGAIWTNSLEPHSEEQKQTMKRFASVFSLTFRRYQDLQKAETQAREATIEAALERVRGKAMAMHSSKDLATTIGVFYHELEGLNLTPRRCGVGLINKETMIAEISTMNASADGEGIEMVGNLDLRSHPVLTGVYDNWLTKTEYHPVLRGNEIKEYYQIVRPQISFPDYPNDTAQYGYFFFFEEGGVYAWTEKELNEEELKIHRRFTSVLSLTYKRYKDLKDAEARTQTAIKDAALDRIRADIASMRTVNDLDRITPLIWNELTVLGIPFIRCGVFIMDDAQQLIHTFLSTPDGKAIAAFHLPYDTPGNLNNVVANWKENRNYIDHWDETEFIQFADILVKEGALVSSEQYLKTIPKGGFYLHFLPFLQGMLYVGNTDQLKAEQIELIQHVADAFSTAYARYEDFNKLEAAKQQVEKTLTDLKQAQTQLVQSEKMASLGEMTAGIAHEIQNPLNFVNNFSEVSKELLDEMKTELETGNTDDAKDIADDVIRNLEKINHHGKRADAIVKSMLQHSRSGSGKKEPIDINALADEYLRLAYHGLRAKDKSFNAKFETAFDDSIGKINIISQDIGRVLVNLINNAFYAVSERKKEESNGYEPTVEVFTKKVDDKIEIKVKDNGNGIPQKVLDKIFQPFFTTKPTGQGTGLGLSLAYDIVTKGHGGELKVETKEGEGSEFIIQLPVNQTTR